MKYLRILTAVLALIMVLSFVACDDASTDDDTSKTEESAASAAPETDPEADPDAAPESDSDSNPESKPEASSSTKPESKPESSSSTKPSSKPATDPEEEPEPEADPNPYKELFKKYQSNVVYGTGNNTLIKSANGDKTEIATYRAIFEVQEFGEFEYSLYFSNNIDSSSGGFSTYRDMPTNDYKILYAALRTTSNMIKCSTPTELTFDGKKTKTVAAGETFWSDPVNFEVDYGDLLVFEWTVEFKTIPGTIVASTYRTYKTDLYGDDLPANIYAAHAKSTIPLPDLIGCTREGNTRLTFVGDSITMGTGSGAFMNSFWVKQIADELGEGYSVWNLGLDSARANDITTGTSFKQKLINTDVISICIGINDIAGGVYGTGKVGALTVYKTIAEIAAMAEEAGAEVIIFSVPPFNLTGEKEDERRLVNNKLEALCEEKGYSFFDFAGVLCDPEDSSKCVYGDHPNKEGCTAVADAFIEAEILEYKD